MDNAVMDNAVMSVYSDLVEFAIEETNLPELTFPEHCPYLVVQLLDKQFYSVQCK